MLLALQLLNLLEAEAAEDTTPDQFTFVDQSGVALSSTITSAAVTITGIDAAAAITVTGGEYDINESGTFTSDAGTVNNGDTVRARGTSSGDYSTATNVTITIGGVSDTFTFTTLADPAAASWSMSGTAVTAEGIMSVSFLDDETEVPGTAVFVAGFAHTESGQRYVALWPASDEIVYVRGIACRPDGAMIIDPSGTIATYRNGWGLTARGEVVATTSTPDLIKAGFGLMHEGDVCMSEVA
jgi:hypothetical protein